MNCCAIIPLAVVDRPPLLYEGGVGFKPGSSAAGAFGVHDAGMPAAKPSLHRIDGVARCRWAGADPLYLAYHDDEWGRPSGDDTRLFEKLVLEGFQSGLSWLTILRKRERFRKVFRGFDPARVARFGARDVERLLGDAGIIRHRGKIEAAIHNATAARAVQREFGSLAAYLWGFAPDPDRLRVPRTLRTVPATTPDSARLAADLRRRGFRFVGPTTVYAFMQAMGFVNDHVVGCASRDSCVAARRAFRTPAAGR
jgi:DNA-3-methyladenine glycosylase I